MSISRLMFMFVSRRRSPSTFFSRSMTSLMRERSRSLRSLTRVLWETEALSRTSLAWDGPMP